MSARLLVTGASGHLGRRVVELLLERGVPGVIAASRTPEKLADLAARGAELRALDFDDPASLDAAFAGVTRALIVSSDALDRPGRRREQHERAVAAAARAGVRHVAYTSFSRPAPDGIVAIGADHFATEVAIRSAFSSYTLLRNNLYTDLLLGALPHAVATGQLITARADGAVAYVTREDCAAAAAGALADGVDAARTLEISGPAALTGDELAAIASRLTGRPVIHVPVPVPAYADGLVAAGLPRPFAEVLASFEASAAAGELAEVSGAVAALAGRAPASVEAFLTANRAALGAA
jgi:NAD(P)H dehydrogenase (quinone)